MFFERRDFFCQRTDPNFNTLLPSGPFPHRPMAAPRARAKRKRRRRRRRARTIPFSSGLSIDSSIGEEAREREGLRGGQRAKKDKRIDREGIMRRALFFVSMRTHLCETMTKKRRARARTRGASSSSRNRALKRPYSPPLRARALVESSSKDRSSRPSPSIDGVAECGVLCFVSRFQRNPQKTRRVLTF